MMRRNMAVIKENVYESVAQDSLVRKEKKRSNRSELEIVKTQEKFGTKHQRPCALCEQSFSEVNLVLAVPFKVIRYSVTWQPGGENYHVDFSWHMQIARLRLAPPPPSSVLNY